MLSSSSDQHAQILPGSCNGQDECVELSPRKSSYQSILQLHDTGWQLEQLHLTWMAAAPPCPHHDAASVSIDVPLQLC